MDQLDILIGKELKSLRISNKKSMQTVADHVGKAKKVIISDGDLQRLCNLLLKENIYESNLLWYLIQTLYYTGMRYHKRFDS